MENPAQPVPAKHINHRITVFVRIFLYYRADITEMRSRTDDLNAAHHTFVGHVAQARRLKLRLSGVIHAAGIAEPAVENNRNVNVYNVAVGQLAVVRNAVTDHMVDRNAG